MQDLTQEQIDRLAAEWRAGRTVAELQALFRPHLSRPRVVVALHHAGINPENWRERNRAVGKPLGPVPALRERAEQICRSYLEGKSLTDLADTHQASRSTIRRVLLDGGVALRRRGRPVKPAVLAEV